MKKRKSYFLVAGIIAIALFIILKPEQEITTETQLKDTVEPEKKLEDSKPEESQVVDVDTSKPSVSNDITKEERQRRWDELNVKGNMPIIFYGKVVDQRGEGISNVRIPYSVSKFDVGLGRAENTYEVSTDNVGSFKIDQGNGLTLLFKGLEKDGYKPSSNSGGSFTYGRFYGGRHSSDSNNPVVFKMWKKGETEELFKYSKHVMRFSPETENRRRINLFSRNGSSNNWDLQIKVNNQGNGSHEAYVWGIELSVNEGGLATPGSNDVFMYEAPEGGYETVFKHEADDNDENWTKAIRGVPFYFKSKNGKNYGRFKLEVVAYKNGKTTVRIQDILINPNGSRNLEFDPDKNITLSLLQN